MSTTSDSSSSRDGFESDDPADYYWIEGDRPDCNICRDFNPRYLDSDNTRNRHHYSSLLRSSRDGCSTCKMLEEIVTGLFKFEDASNVAFTFTNHFFEFREIEGSYIGRIKLRRAADTPCPWGFVWDERHYPENTASQASLSWAENRLQTCLTEHLGCSASTADPLLPTRVLDVGTGDNKTIKVLETKGLRAKYITLSHCWGGPGSMTTKLTARTRGQYLQGIPYEALPLTFRDAVTVTRSLNIRYLWIDSLCIIQKDEEDSPQDKTLHLKDWEHESGRMCSVYQNCYLTLAAVDSTDCTGGFFFKRDMVPMKGNSDKGPYCFYASKENRHGASGFPLLRRGWVKQETLLSPRTLFYGKEELRWLCRTHTVCQCGFFRDYRKEIWGFHKLPLAENARANFTRPQLINTWYKIIEDYSSTSLTHITDKFVAIEGISEYMRPLRNSEYLAGLWADSLAFDLLWHSDAYSYNHKDPTRANHTGPTRVTHTDPLGKTPWSSEKCLFPTWSWASIQGRTGWDWKNWDGMSRFIQEYSPDTVLIQHIKDKSSPANELRLRGVFVPSTLGVIQKVANSQGHYFPDLKNQDDISRVDKRVECLRVVQLGKDCISLVLICVNEEKRLYERLGLLTLRYTGTYSRKRKRSKTQVEMPSWWAPSEDWKGEEVEFTLI